MATLLSTHIPTINIDMRCVLLFRCHLILDYILIIIFVCVRYSRTFSTVIIEWRRYDCKSV